MNEGICHIAARKRVDVITMYMTGVHIWGTKQGHKGAEVVIRAPRQECVDHMWGTICAPTRISELVSSHAKQILKA